MLNANFDGKLPTDVLRRLDNLVTPDFNLHIASDEIRIDRETSMQAATAQETAILNAFIQPYQAEIRENGVENILDELRFFLVDEYDRNPAKVNNQSLPCHVVDDNLNEQTLRAYYQHPIHTAIRYLSENNPLGARPIIDQEQYTIIAAFWLALNDPDFQLPNNVTKEVGKGWLINTLASICRQHNWDGERYNPETRVQEYYDDLRRDHPSCVWGVKRNLIQYLNQVLLDDPLLRPLNTDIMANHLKNYFITEETNHNSVFQKIQRMDLATLRATYDALDILFDEYYGDYSLLNEEQVRLIQALNWTQDDAISFIAECNLYYGRNRIQGYHQSEIAWSNATNMRRENFRNYGQVIVATLKDSIFDLFTNEMRLKIQDILDKNFKSDAVKNAFDNLNTDVKAYFVKSIFKNPRKLDIFKNLEEAGQLSLLGKARIPQRVKNRQDITKLDCERSLKTNEAKEIFDHFSDEHRNHFMSSMRNGVKDGQSFFEKFSQFSAQKQIAVLRAELNNPLVKKPRNN